MCFAAFAVVVAIGVYKKTSPVSKEVFCTGENTRKKFYQLLKRTPTA